MLISEDFNKALASKITRLSIHSPAVFPLTSFTVTRMDAWGETTWFMCTPKAAEKLIAMDFENLTVKETTIMG